MQNVTLNNGIEMPIEGYGVFQIKARQHLAGHARDRYDIERGRHVAIGLAMDS